MKRRSHQPAQEPPLQTSQDDNASAPKEISAEEVDKRHLGRPFSRLIHKKGQESLLSVTSVDTDYRGFFNLFVIVLVAANLRLMVENLLKYGWRIQPPSGLFDFYRNWPFSVCILEMVCLVAFIWFIERHLSLRIQSDLVTNILHGLAIAAMVLVPVLAVWNSAMTESSSVLLMMFSLAWGMKMVSYTMTCFDIRRAVARGIVDEVCKDDDYSRRVVKSGYPGCLTLKDMLLFLAYPTLCFQLHYPRSARIRKRRLARHILALLLCLALAYVLLEQYISPLLLNARQYIKMVPGPDGVNVLQVSFVGLLERLLKLAMPNLYLWLLMFYGLFHSYLNILAELTCFDDRRFYSDWWNAASFGEYWKRWNLPVHHWCLRHVYFPMIRRRWSKLSAGVAVFLLSGILHELLVVVPLRMTRPTVLVTLAFLAQLPLTIITSRPLLEKKYRWMGNGIFWCIFCFTGQPAAILIYFFLAVDPSLETFGSLLSLR